MRAATIENNDAAPSKAPPARDALRLRVRIGLFGPYGWGNLGDAAIQDSILHHIRRRRPDAAIVGLSLNPDDTRLRHGIPAHPIRRRAPTGRGRSVVRATAARRGAYARSKRILDAMPIARSVFRAVRAVRRGIEALLAEARAVASAARVAGDLDLLIVSGGGQLCDVWGGPWAQPYSLFKWSLLARLRGARVRFVSVGAYPIRSCVSRTLVRFALFLAEYRSYRDAYSRGVARSLGVPASDPIFPDLAWSLPIRRSGGGGTPGLVGISPIAWADPRSWPVPDEKAYRTYVGEFAKLALHLRDRGRRIVVFPSEIHMDRLVIDDLLSIMERDRPGSSRDSIIDEPVRTVEDLLARIGATEIVVASRMHSVLLALLAHRLVIAVACERKVIDLMESVGLSRYCIGAADFRADSTAALIRSLEVERREVIAALEAKTEEYRRRLEEQYDALFC